MPKEKLLDVIRGSVYSPDFYKALLSKPLSWSIKYFFSFTLVLAVISTAVFGWRLVPAVNSFLNNIAPAVLKYYPEGLEVVIKDGEATSNVVGSSSIPFPPELLSSQIKSGDLNPDFKYLLVINTNTNLVDWKEFQDYKTLALLTKDALVFTDKNGGIRVQPLKGVPDTTINKKEVTAMLDGIKPFIKFAAPILVLFMFLGAYSVLSFKLIYLFLAALLIWLIAKKFRKLDVGYKKAYQIGLHAITAAFLLEICLQIFFGVRIPYLFTIATFLAAWFNLDFRKEEFPSVSPKDSQPPSVT